MRAKFLCLVALAFASACDGGITPPPPPPPPPAKETLSVVLNGPADGSVIRGTNPSVTATAIVSSNRGTVAAVNVTWSLNGTPENAGMNITLAATPGQNMLCAHVVGVVDATTDKCLSFTFTPTAVCKVVRDYPVSDVLTGSPLRITYTRGSQTATRIVGADGDCSIESPIVLLGATDSLSGVLDVDADGIRTHNAMKFYAGKADMDKGLTLIQMSKVYPASGAEVSVDLSLCYVAGSDGLSFCPRHVVPSTGGRYWYETESFLPSALPLPTLLSDNPEPISAQKAAVFWSAVDRVNQLLGFTFLKQAAASDVVNGTTSGYLVNLNSKVSGNAAAGTNLAWNGASYIGGTTTFYGEVAINSMTSMHEIIHMLGIGHGCGFPSIMAVFCGPNGYQETAEPTQYDIAYTLQRIRVRELERKYGTKFSYCENHQGLRVIERGQAEEFCFKDHP
jgi:hypothetical protein